MYRCCRVWIHFSCRLYRYRFLQILMPATYIMGKYCAELLVTAASRPCIQYKRDFQSELHGDGRSWWSVTRYVTIFGTGRMHRTSLSLPLLEFHHLASNSKQLHVLSTSSDDVILQGSCLWTTGPPSVHHHLLQAAWSIIEILLTVADEHGTDFDKYGILIKVKFRYGWLWLLLSSLASDHWHLQGRHYG